MVPDSVVKSRMLGFDDEARAVAGLLVAANDAERSDGALNAANDAEQSDAASDTGAGPLKGIDDAPQLWDVLLFCSEV